MRHRDVAVILATGGMGLVRAAYSAGKPAYGVGPGNAPCYIERSADPAGAAHDIILGKTFDNGLLCSSPNSVVVDAPVAEEVRRQFEARGARFLSPAEAALLAAALVTPQRLPNPKLVGRSAKEIGEIVGIPLADGVRVLIATLDGVGRDYPLSIEKLCPVLSWYVVQDWREGCERCIQILRYGGMGHTMSVHSQNDEVVLQFGLKKPAFRICVNTPTTHGSIGLTTGLDPAMTLGCGGVGGNSTSDNISPRHLLNLKRVASPGVGAPAGGRASLPSSSATPSPAVPQAPAKPAMRGISADELRSKVDRFLSSRGYKGGGEPVPAAAPSPANRPANVAAVAFVCEDDVRQAMQAGTTILLGEKTIVTPAARDLGTANNVFAPTSWPR
jgi:acetaldehyde dehydrogenase (acetylating)